MISEILLRRKHKLTVQRMDTHFSETGDVEVYRHVLAISKNIESLGFAFDVEVISALKTYTIKELYIFYGELIHMLKKLCAADVEYRPMYPNFPQQVASMEDVELYMNAILHYFTYGEWLPEYTRNERMPLVDDGKITVLSLGTTEDLYDLFGNLLRSKTSLSNQDKADLKWIMLNYPEYEKYIPDEIPLKENVALLASYMLSINPNANAASISKFFKTATDVLRFIVSISDGDISLAERTNFKHLSRPERRLVMDLLAGCGNILEDMFRYRDEWIRIGEIIHPGEFTRNKYDGVTRAFETLRNHHKPLFVIGQVENALKVGDTITAAMVLMQRPGEFARRLDKLLRDSTMENRAKILDMFRNVADKISSAVLLQVRQVFLSRCKDKPEVRVFMPKGSVARAVSVPYDLPEIDSFTCARVVHICTYALIDIYKEREPMGTVYIDPKFKDYLVPFSQRSASSGNKILIRGSKIPIGENTTTIRAFIWWTNTKKDGYENRVDIDLSAMILDEDFNYCEHISYTRLREDKCYHSGDIVNGGSPDGSGVAEFVDMYIQHVLDVGGRYICYQVYNYTSQKFSDLPNCRFGWMEREYPNSGEIFEPSKVEMAINLTSDSTVSVPVLFDCVEKRFIWMDMGVGSDGFHRYNNNLENNLSGVQAAVYSIVNIKKPSLYDLVYLNALARGCQVFDPENADMIFSNEVNAAENPEDYKDKKVITAFDTDYFMGDLL